MSGWDDLDRADEADREKMLHASEAQLTRVQRALALLSRQKPTRMIRNGVRAWKQNGMLMAPDYREKSHLPFENDVYFLALDTYVKRDITGKVLGLDVGIATLDTRDLHNFAPGKDGSFYTEEIRKNFIGGGHSGVHPLCNHEDDHRDHFEPLITEGAMRNRLAIQFEVPIPHEWEYIDCYVANDWMYREPRNVIVVVQETYKVLEDLLVVGFDLKEHWNVVEIVDLPDMAMAYHQHQTVRSQEPSHPQFNAAARPLYHDVMAELGIDPTAADHRCWVNSCYDTRDCAHRAQTILQALLLYAFRDQKCPRGFHSAHYQDGGDFKVPFRESYNHVPRFLERALSVETCSTAGEIKRKVNACLDVLHTSISSANHDDAVPRSCWDEAHESDATQTSAIETPRRDYQPTVREPASEPCDSQPPVSHAVQTPDRVAQATLEPFPEGLVGAYKNAGEIFAEELVEAARKYCNIDQYAEVVDKWIDGAKQRQWVIRPASGYPALARIVRAKKKKAIKRRFLFPLMEEIRGRDQLDRWFRDLPDGHPRKQDEESSHPRFTALLKQTQAILMEK